MIKKERIGIITLGCSKNTVDSERLIKQMKFHNLRIVEDLSLADTVLINTCGFIEDAKQESINTILEAVEKKEEKQLKRIIVFGCLSQRYKEDLKKEIPEVDVYYGVEEYDKILKEFGKSVDKGLLNERLVSTPDHYSFLKISEGCNNPCSFCAIPLIRGKHRSIPMKNLLHEAKDLTSQGAKELILIAQDTTYYGLDIYKKRNLALLLKKLTKINYLEWIRLLYAYPSNFPEDVLQVMKNEPKICKYLDIPLQHISDNVLKSMRRGISSSKTRKLIEKIRKEIPDITLRTTFIVGYPNETNENFKELINFIEEYQFDRVGAFKYSPEEDTSGFRLGDPVSDELKSERLSELMEVQKEISLRKNQEQTGKIKKVIIDSVEGNYYIGRSESEAPEVDGEILIEKKPGVNLKTGNFYEVEIYDANEYDLFANPK